MEVINGEIERVERMWYGRKEREEVDVEVVALDGVFYLLCAPP